LINPQGGGYLELVTLQAAPPKHHRAAADARPSDEPTPAAAQADGGAAPAPVLLTQWTHHIVYSPSYRQPVMYFQAHDASGAPLPNVTVLAALRAHGGGSGGGGGGDSLAESGEQPGTKPAAAAAEPLPGVTQEEHPVLGRPFYMLHPCQTEEVLALVLRQRAAATCQPLVCLLAWLSLAGQPLGIAPQPGAWRACIEAVATPDPG
jgi:ubiquitin-like-conjugating enzyme ATG10